MKRNWWERFKLSSAHTQANIVCTAIIMLATIAYAGIAGFQFIVMKQQLNQMSMQLPEIQKSATAAENAATAAHNSITQSENHFRLDQRPYVAETTNSVVAPKFQPTHDDLGQILWNYRITNYGKSPAYDVRERRFIRIGDGPWVESYTGGKTSHRTGTAMAPTADTLSTVISEPMTSQAFKNLIGSKLGDPISIKASITYRDSYGTAYETDICLAYNAFFAIGFCEGNYIK